MNESQLLPARAVNEHTFCPRLFWYEEVAGVFIDNEHTLEGHQKHRRVDKPGGSMPAPDDEHPVPIWDTRSLWLSNPEIGVTAKLDYVDKHRDAVMPVDTKKGRAKPGGELWPADDVQLTLQGLLLRAAGYRVEQVAAYYAEERRRVFARLTKEREQRARQAVAEARKTMELPTPPPPLIDSPKCRGCSLNPVCLPDETNFLRNTEQSGEIRSIVPRRADAIPVYVSSYSARIGVSKACLKVVDKHSDDPPQVVGLNTISQVNIFGTAQITTQALKACMERGINVSFFSGGGWFYGRVSPPAQPAVYTRIAQFSAAQLGRATPIAARLVSDKIANGRVLLRRNNLGEATTLARLDELSKRALDATEQDQILAIEGEAAKRYWEAFSNGLEAHDPAFAMNGRTRRPPRDRTNAMLSFLYALLVKDCTHAVATAGLDPALGLYHQARAGRPSLALDLMEPFRRLVVDSVVWRAVRQDEVKAEGFVETGEAVRMKPHTRKRLIRGYERRVDELITHPVFGYRIRYRQVFAVHARLLSRVLTGELDALPAFRTR